MASALPRLLSLKQIRQRAGEVSFARGRDYLAEGRVGSLVVHGDTLNATVVGSETYQVRLTAESGGLSCRCSCPIGAEGAFCKHCVAVGLAWLGASPESAGESSSPGTPPVSLDDLRPWLIGQSSAVLAELLLETATRDDRLREKLLRSAARATAKGVDFAAYRKSIDRATRSGGFVDYYSAGGYAEGVREAAGPLREILSETPEHAAVVIELVEYALVRVEEAIESIDDSDGEIGSVLGELQELHLDACKAARPDPEELAARLFAWEISDDWGLFHQAADTYADVLGAAGLAVYRRLAEAEWKKLPALKAGDREDCTSNRFHLTSIMEALARTSGNVDALVTIKEKNLSSPFRYLEIAELYRTAKRSDDALRWAERGLKAFPQNTDVPLLEFLADEYHQRSRADEALGLMWRPFATRTSLENYQLLKRHADRTGAWPQWRSRALAVLREKIAREGGDKKMHFDFTGEQGFHAVLVRVFLWEKDHEVAWAEAQQRPVSRGLALELAAIREQDHPADAIPIYLREVGALVAQTGNRSYETAVQHLKKVRSLHLRLDLTDEWIAVLTRLRAQHKAKRNFIALAATL